jgi:hypothetical protein
MSDELISLSYDDAIKVACIDCEHCAFDGWENGKPHGRYSKCNKNPTFHPVMGNHQDREYCEFKNENGECKDYEPKENRQTNKKETWIQKAWNYVAGILHK